MEPSLDLIALSLIACAAVAALTLRLRQSVIIGYLFAGILVGPYGLGWVTDAHRVEQLGDLGVVFLLFLLGNELSLERIRPLAKPAFLGGTLQVSLTLAAGMAIMRLFGWNWYRSAYLGCAIAISSTAILVKLLGASDELRAPQGRFALGVVLFQDLAVVPMMVILPVLAKPEGGLFLDILKACAKAAAFLALSFGAGRWIIPKLLKMVTRSRSQELFILTVLAIALGLAVLSNRFGLSLAMGAFVAGLALGQSPYSQKVLADVFPFRDVFLSIFFVSIGMLLDWKTALGSTPVIAAMVALIIAVKTLVIVGVGRFLGLPTGMAIRAGLALSQVSEFSFILVRMGYQQGHVDKELYQIIISSSVVTMALTPWLVKLGTLASNWRFPAAARAPCRGGEVRTGVSEGGHPESSGHVIICGYGPVGRMVAEALQEVGVPFVILELNPDTVERVRRQGLAVLYGDARSEVLLERAGIRRAKALVVAIPNLEISEGVVRNARLAAPGVPIYARAVFLPHLRRLQEAGATIAVHDEREAGLAILRALLEREGKTAPAMEDLLGKIGK